MAKRPRHGIEGEAEIEVERIAHIRLAVDSDRKAENLEVCQGDADEASLKLYFWDHIV
jgi:hypothetical protein